MDLSSNWLFCLRQWLINQLLYEHFDYKQSIQFEQSWQVLFLTDLFRNDSL